MGVARRANIKNQQLTTASTFHYVKAVALFSHPPDHSGGYFNIIVSECKLTPVAVTTEQKKEEYKEVISFLKRGYSVRNTATLANVSVSTVQRVKREFSI